MPPVFGHGRLRLYLLKLLGQAPRHGYEVIRLLEERFQGLYAPSAGTVYPRLAKLEAEGLVSHREEGGRKVYALTAAGRAELSARDGELTALEREIHNSLAALAAGIREDGHGAAPDLRAFPSGVPHEFPEEVRRAAAAPRAEAHAQASGTGSGPSWREEARRARREARDARKDARRAAADAAAARAHVEQAARRVRERLQPHAARGDWRSAVREGLEGLSQEFGGFGHAGGRAAPARPSAWSHEPEEPVTEPARELERLLDKFRDDVRDAARDHGVTQEQLREARRTLSESAARLVALLRLPPHG